MFTNGTAKPWRRLVFLALSFFTVLACTLTTAVNPVADIPGWPSTAAARTWSAMETMAFLSATPTFTVAPPTNTPMPTPTLWSEGVTPSPTNTEVPMITPLPTETPTITPSITPFPTPTGRIVGGGGSSSGGSSSGGGSGGGSGGTGNSVPCYRAALSRNLTIPDGEILRPGTVFTKIWRVKNTGSCTWPITTRMVAAKSTKNSLWDGISAPVGTEVEPGKEADFAITLVAPITPGKYFEGFIIRIDKANFITPADEAYFSVNFISANTTGEIWDFSNKKRLCDASWKVGSKNLKCPGPFLSNSGFLASLPAKIGKKNFPATMEDGVTYPRVLWTSPPTSGNREISGTFTALLIQNGDRIRASVGCLSGYEKCNVTFQILYQFLGGAKTPLTPEFNEVYDGVIHTLIDQSISGGAFDFTNQYVMFTFRVRGYSEKGQDAAGWINMLIYR